MSLRIGFHFNYPLADNTTWKQRLIRRRMGCSSSTSSRQSKRDDSPKAIPQHACPRMGKRAATAGIDAQRARLWHASHPPARP